MKNFPNDKRNLDSKKYYYNFNGEFYEKKNVFYSTFKNELKVPINPGNLLFVLYVVEDLLFNKIKHEYNEDEEEKDEDNKDDDKSENTSENDSNYNNNSISEKSKEEEYSESKSNES